MDTQPTKFCGTCGETKPVKEFYPIARGYHSECKECSRKRYNEWRKKNREKHAKRNLGWYEANKEKVLSRYKRYRDSLGDNRKNLRIGEHYKNAEKNRARASAWAKANKEKRKVNHLRREARKRRLPTEWTVQEMRAAIKRWGNCCPVCGVDLDGKRHWDHWIPLICPDCPGTVKKNMVPLCGRCNTRKNDCLPDAWLKRMFPTTWETIKKRVEDYLNS